MPRIKSKRFSPRYKTYNEWLKRSKGSKSYKQRIKRLHLEHPKATLAQLRGHPRVKERSLSQRKQKPTIKYTGVSPKIKKELQNVDDTVIKMMYMFGMSPYEIYNTIHQYPCMSGISFRYISYYLKRKKKIFNTMGRLHERIDIMYEFAEYLMPGEVENQVKHLYSNYLKSSLISALDYYYGDVDLRRSQMRALYNRYGCLLNFANDKYSFHFSTEAIK